MCVVWLIFDFIILYQKRVLYACLCKCMVVLFTVFYVSWGCVVSCVRGVCVCMYITDRAEPWREKRLHGCAACPAGLPHCCMLHFVNIIVSVFVAMRVCVYIYKYKYSREYFFQNFVGDLKLLDQKTKRNAHSHSHCCCCCFSPPTKTVHLGHTHKSASFSTSRFGCV